MRVSQREKAHRLEELHGGARILVLPNVWDAVSARIVEAEGFPAAATSSSGCAAVFGYPDGQCIPRGEMIYLIAKIVSAVDIPVSADVEAGYDDPVQTALDVVAAGAVGLNLEDRIKGEILPIEEQKQRIRAVRSGCGFPLVINARTDIFLASHGEENTRFDRAVERLNEYLEAGADSLFCPGVKDAETIGRLVAAVRGPLNILAVPGSPSIPELRDLGVARVSFGGGPSRVAMGAFRSFARRVKEAGRFEALSDVAIPALETQKLLKRS
jgi:2-methylisocitrate lyase-like PEP mutase family enzyme